MSAARLSGEGLGCTEIWTLPEPTPLRAVSDNQDAVAVADHRQEEPSNTSKERIAPAGETGKDSACKLTAQGSEEAAAS